MPLSILRLNQRHAHPSPNVTFIRPLPGPSSQISEAYLSRIAAISHPILVQHGIAITTLEEHEPNPEFIGRNFNAGECIQLVLRTRTGGWIPFRSVVMVAMHELAHCKQMNHSRAFWAVRDAYVAEMKGLWARGYTGEGVWGRGRELGMGQFEVRGEVWDEVGMPERLCGGVFRTRGRGKRRRVTAAVAAAANQQLTYVEREKRRVERKFGVGGEKVGEDQGVKFFLDGGKSIAGKPRVAGSNRGRELRAQAALIRLGAQKVEDQVVKKEEGKVKKEEMEEGDWEEFEDEDAGRDDAVDYDGAKMKDGEGKVMVKVCEDEDVDDVHVKQEMDELTDLWSIPEVSKTTDKYKTQPTNRKLGRPGENIYSAGTGSHVKKIEQSSEKSQINGTDDMRSKLNTVHQNGSIVDALKRQEKKAKAKK